MRSQWVSQDAESIGIGEQRPPPLSTDFGPPLFRASGHGRLGWAKAQTVTAQRVTAQRGMSTILKAMSVAHDYFIWHPASPTRSIITKRRNSRSNAHDDLELSLERSRRLATLTRAFTATRDSHSNVHHHTGMHPRLQAALRARPSPSDRPGCFYLYKVSRRQPRLPNRRGRRAQIKMGRAKDPPKRRLQWLRQCRGQQQVWWCYWEVPFAAKFEQLIHLHYKLLGAWLGRRMCDFCPVKHQEKYDLKGCGGRAAVVQQVESYAALLHWPVISYLSCNAVGANASAFWSPGVGVGFGISSSTIAK
ncbi:hypothetical protein FB451DRAFT_1190872 [Mycena latifolia]|nr:hypothetical protein FB451DRAFT_1190872 [Mycena latifolia]